MRVNKSGETLIKSSEELRLTAYLCPAGVPTIGWGHIKTVTMAMVKAGYTITLAQAEALFRRDVAEFEFGVRRLCTRVANDNEFSAMVSFAFNVGLANFAKSSVLKAHNRGDADSAARAFSLWNKARVNGVLKELRGLTTRRAREASLYLRPAVAAEAAPVADAEPVMVQRVEPESVMSKSPIVPASTVAGATSAAVAVADVTGKISLSDVATQASDAAAIAHSASSTATLLSSATQWLIPIALIAITIAAGVVIYQRMRQRTQGWA